MRGDLRLLAAPGDDDDDGSAELDHEFDHGAHTCEGVADAATLVPQQSVTVLCPGGRVFPLVWDVLSQTYTNGPGCYVVLTDGQLVSRCPACCR